MLCLDMCIQMYQSYIDCAKITVKDILNYPFKSNNDYNTILEHVSPQLGSEYLSLIRTEFPNIKLQNIFEFVEINDKIGNPIKINYFIENQILSCSPSNLRYIYHSLLILSEFKTKNNNGMTEVGCGYGGLFLAICFFSKILDIKIDIYYLIDLPEVCDLIKEYLNVNKDYINIKYEIKHSTNYGKDVENNNLFFISNYCFTEIDQEYRNNYIENLIPKVTNGFIVWQTIAGPTLSDAKNIFKNIHVLEEKPQTATLIKKNYFIYF